MDKYFITGVTGVVGSALLKKLLKETSNPIVLLIRGQDHVQKLQSVFSFLKIDFDLYKERISIINASAETKLFGLQYLEYSRLAESVKVIFNCAANVDLMQNGEVANRHSLESLANITELMDINQKIKLEHVSTVGVNGKNKAGLSEARIDPSGKFFNTYESSKALTEAKIYSQMDLGRRITVHRPSMVVGDEQTGAIIHFQIFYFLLRLISGEFTAGFIPPILNLKLDTIPSNFVAELLFRSSQSTISENRIIHHCSGPEKSLRLEQFVNCLLIEKQKLFLPIKKTHIISERFFSKSAALASHLPLPEKWKIRVGLLPQLLEYASQDQIFLNDKTKILFQDLHWPDPAEYIQLSINYYLKKRFRIQS